MPAPTLTDQYWFDYSKTVVDDALKQRDSAAQAIQKLALWLWGIYTSATAVGFALFQKALSLEATLLIVAASGALIVVYWATVWVQMPVLKSFDPRSPVQIRRAYVDAVERKRNRLAFTLFLSLIAAVMVAAAIVVAAVAKPVTLPTPLPAFDLTAVLARATPGDEKDTVELQLATQLPGVQKVRALLLPQDGGEVLYDREKRVLDGVLITTTEPFPASAALRLELRWTDANGVAITVSKTLALPKSGK